MANQAKPLDQKTDAELEREAKARLKRLSPAQAAAVVSDVMAQPVLGPAAGFVNFLREKAVVGLAIGFVIGTQVQGVVKGFIADFIDTLFKLVIPGNRTLSQQSWVFHGAEFKWGDMVYQLLDFFFILLMIYLVIHLGKLDRLDKKE